jgi:hypothetical protein
MTTLKMSSIKKDEKTLDLLTLSRKLRVDGGVGGKENIAMSEFLNIFVLKTNVQ